MKIVGMLCLFSAGVYMIFLIRTEQQKQQRQLEQWISQLENLQGEIRWHHVSILNYLVSKELTSKISQYMKTEITLQNSWAKMVDKMNDKDLKNVLINVNFSGDQENLLQNLSYVVQRLKDLRERRAEEIRKTGRILSAAVFSGIGILIILLL